MDETGRPEERALSPDLERITDEKADAGLGPGGLRTVELGLPANEVVSSVSKEEEARILRKIDVRLVPLLSFLYLWVPIEICGRFCRQR